MKFVTCLRQDQWISFNYINNLDEEINDFVEEKLYALKLKFIHILFWSNLSFLYYEASKKKSEVAKIGRNCKIRNLP